MKKTGPFNPFEYAAGLLESQVNPLDPVDWAQRKAKITLWSKQQEIIRSVRDNRRTAVRSGHGIGKSLTASVTASWWIDTHPPEETIVVTTAPSVAQVHAILWEEIRKIHNRAGLAGEVQISDRWIINQRLVGFGRKPQDHDKDAFQGIHRKFVLVIIDEAAGIDEWLWDAARNITTGEHCRVLAIGNPTDPSSHFRKVCEPTSGWNVIKISVFDSPKFTGEPMAKEALEDLTGPEYVEEARADLGEGTPMWNARVLGEFPSDNDDLSVIPLGWIYQAQERWQQWKESGGEIPWEYRKVVGVDPARFGGDKTAVAVRYGDLCTEVMNFPRRDTVGTAQMVTPMLNRNRGDIAVVDSNGIGAGVYDVVKRTGYAMGVNVGNRTKLTDTTGKLPFYNLRAALMWKLREALDPARGSTLMLPPDERMATDLSAPFWKMGPGGTVIIESKDDLRKRLGRSPDKGDAVALAFWASAGFSFQDPGEASFDWATEVPADEDTAVEWDAGSFSMDSFLSNVPNYDGLF